MKKTTIVSFAILLVLIIFFTTQFTGFVVHEDSRYIKLKTCMQNPEKTLNECRLELGVVSLGAQQEDEIRSECIVNQEKTFEECVQEINDNQGVIVFNQQQEINEDITFPQNIKIKLEENAQFLISQGTTIQIQGLFEAPEKLIFSGEGKIEFTNPSIKVYPIWWGHSPENEWQTNDQIMKSVMDSLSNGGIVQLSEGTFEHKLIEVGDKTTLQGSGCSLSCIKEGDADTCCDTIIKLPDFPDEDEQRYLVSDPNNPALAESGITAVSGITECAIKNLEYDGNAQKNLNWVGRGSGKRFPFWEGNDYDYIKSQGIMFGRHNSRIPPQKIKLENLYVHDILRNALLAGDSQIEGKNIRLKNSAIDHLIYMSHSGDSKFENLLLEGYWSGDGLRSFGQEFNNVVFKNIKQNPLKLENPESRFFTSILVAGRSTSSPNRQYIFNNPTRINDLKIVLDEDIPLGGVVSNEATIVENVFVEQIGERTKPFTLFSIASPSPHTSAQKFFTAKNVNYEGADDKMLLFSVSGDENIPAKDINIQDVTISFKEQGFSSIKPLIILNNNARNIDIKDLTLLKGSKSLVTTYDGKDISDVSFSNVNMCDSSIQRLSQIGAGTENIEIIDSKILGYSPDKIKGSASDKMQTDISQCN